MKKYLIFTLVLINSYACLAQDYKKFEVNNKFGFKDKTGKVVIPATFESAWDKFSEGLVGVYNGKKWGYIDSTGKVVIPYRYHEVSEFYKKRAIVYNNYLVGYINEKGETIVPVIYDDVQYTCGREGEFPFSKKGTFLVTLNDKSGVLNEFGNINIPLKYKIHSYINNPIGESFYIVSYEGKYGSIDQYETVIIPLKYELIKVEDLFSNNNRLKSKLNGKEGYLDYSGKVL